MIANNDAAKVRVDGKMRVDGVLVVQGYRLDNEVAALPSKMGLTVKGTLMVGKPDDGSASGNWSSNAKGAINPASFIILGDAKTENPLVFESGNGVDVRGIFSIMGNALQMDFSTGANVNVFGSLNTVSPSDASLGLDIKFRNGAHIELEYMEGNFDKSAERLMTFFVAGDELVEDETPPPGPIQIRAYLEAPSSRRALVLAGIAAAGTGSFGVAE